MSSSRCSFRRTGAANRPVWNRGSGSGRPRSAFTAGRTKSSNVTRTETGLPGRLKIGVSRRTLNATGFPGFTLTPQKTSSDSKLRLDGTHQVVRAHGCSSRGHEHVEAKQSALHRATELLLVVRDDAELGGDSSGVAESCRQQ